MPGSLETDSPRRSIRSASSSRLPPASPRTTVTKSSSKAKVAEQAGVFDMSALSQAIPGPGDEIPAEQDAGVKDEEKVTVVFMVRTGWATP